MEGPMTHVFDKRRSKASAQNKTPQGSHQRGFDFVTAKKPHYNAA
jgi:hypothetical protein